MSVRPGEEIFDVLAELRISIQARSSTRLKNWGGRGGSARMYYIHVHVCIGSGWYCTNVLRVQSESVLPEGALAYGPAIGAKFFN